MTVEQEHRKPEVIESISRAGYEKYRRDFAPLIWQLARRSEPSMRRRLLPSTTRIMSLS
jgi:hypothetical protein